MSRSGYSDDGDFDSWSQIRWRGAVASATRGKRGQALLRDMLAALEAMPEKRLIAHQLRVREVNPLLPWLFASPDIHYRMAPLPSQCGVCAMGALGEHRGVDLDALNVEDYDQIATTFDVASPLVQEIEWENDDGGHWKETPERRWQRVREWVASQIKPPTSPEPAQ